MKKLFIIAIMLITGLGAGIFTEKNKNVTEEKTEILTEESEITEVAVDDTEIKTITENEVVDEEIVEKEEKDEKIEQPKQTEVKTKIPQNTTSAQSTPKSSNSEKNSNSSSNTNSKPKDTPTTQSKNDKGTNIDVQPNIVEEKKENASKTKELTPSDLEYWCVHGGKHHLSGDGANEHGYYFSWDKAYQAFEEYSKNWASGQYKVSQCECGLYYFWAIEN